VVLETGIVSLDCWALLRRLDSDIRESHTARMSGVTEESAIWLVETGVATRFFVDLDFVAGMQGDERLVAGGINGVRRGIGQARIAKTDEDTGVVVTGTERMR